MIAPQRRGGNEATIAVQRRRGERTLLDTKGVPIKGPDVREVLREKAPGLLVALSRAQLEQWQRAVDFHAIGREVRRHRDYLRRKHATSFRGDRKYEFATRTRGYKRANAMLERVRMPQHRHSEDTLVVDAKLLLSDDVKDLPKWDIVAETAFRKYAVGRLTEKPLELDIGKPDVDPYVLSRHVPNEKGVITLAALRKWFKDEYREMVTHRPAMVTLRKGIREIHEVMDHYVSVHKTISGMNEAQNLVRHIAELLGEGSQKYVSIRGWDRPKQDLEKGEELLEQQPIAFELALPYIARSQQATVEMARKVAKYEWRVLSGAQGAVKWLGRLEALGSIAAGIASGGSLGIVGGALASGGYTLVQGGARQASAMGHGLEQSMKAGKLLTDAGIATVMALIGGPLQQRFGLAMRARLGLADDVFSKVWTDSVSAGLSSVYTTGAELTLRQIITGKTVVKSADDFAKLLVQNALKDAVLDVVTRPFNTRAAVEAAAAKAGKPVPPLFRRVKAGKEATGVEADGKDRSFELDADAAAGRQMSADATRRLLEQSEGWKQVRSDLESGKGLGDGLDSAQRKALLDRFEIHRQTVAREAATLFGGELHITTGDSGRRIDVHFPGPDGAKHAQQAKAYLDQKRPGWAKQTDVGLLAKPISSLGLPESGKLMAELGEHMTSDARQLASDLVPIYEDWSSLDVRPRMDRLIAPVNERLEALGVPKVGIGPHKNGGGKFNPTTWEVRLDAALLNKKELTPEEFGLLADYVAHEGRHALQIFRAARLDPGKAVQNGVDWVVVRSAEAATLGFGKPDKLTASELVAAKEIVESLWGQGSLHRGETFELLTDAEAALDSATHDWEKAKDRAPEDLTRKVAEGQLQDAYAALDKALVRYMNLPEETDAWKHGLATGKATREELALRSQLDTARPNERLQRLGLMRAIDRAAELTLSPEDLARQLQEWKKALEKVKTIEGKLVKIMTGRNP